MTECVFSLQGDNAKMFLLSMSEIAIEQSKDMELKELMSKISKRIFTKQAVNNVHVVLQNDKVFVPTALHKRIMKWYHH